MATVYIEFSHCKTASLPYFFNTPSYKITLSVNQGPQRGWCLTSFPASWQPDHLYVGRTLLPWDSHRIDHSDSVLSPAFCFYLLLYNECPHLPGSVPLSPVHLEKENSILPILVSTEFNTEKVLSKWRMSELLYSCINVTPLNVSPFFDHPVERKLLCMSQAVLYLWRPHTV